MSRRIQEKIFPDGAASGSEGMEGEAEIASFQMQLIARRITPVHNQDIDRVRGYAYNKLRNYVS